MPEEKKKNGKKIAVVAGIAAILALLLTRKKAKAAPPEGYADIRVENLTIQPSEVYVGETVTISVVVTNYGGAAGSKTIVCTVS